MDLFDYPERPSWAALDICSRLSPGRQCMANRASVRPTIKISGGYKRVKGFGLVGHQMAYQRLTPD